MALASILGHFLSQYDETAVEGVTRLVSKLKEDTGFADTFLADRQSTAAFIGLFKRKTNLALLYRAIPTLLSLSTKPNAVSFAQQLCTSVIFINCVKKDLDHVTDTTVATVNAALECMTAVVAFTPDLLLARLGGGSIPLHLSALSKSQISWAQTDLRVCRTAFLAAFLTTPLRENLFLSVIRSYGFLTHLLQDVYDAVQQDAGTSAEMAKVVDLFRTRFVASTLLSGPEKRRLISSQSSVLRCVVKLLSLEGEMAEVAGVTLRELIPEVREVAEDYALQKQEDDERMPNHLLFTLTRMLRPRRRLIDMQLLVFILRASPDLIRPYITRASNHLTSNDDDGRSAVSGYLSVVNTMTRIFLSPLPFHLTSGSSTLIPVGVSPHTFHQLAPSSVADEVMPSWLGEYLQKLIAQDTLLYTTWAIQCAQAAVLRATRIKAVVEKLFQTRRTATSAADSTSLGSREEGAMVGVDEADAFMAEVDRILVERLPKREEVWHRVTRQLLPNVATTEGPSRGDKVQFVLQRCFLLMMGYTELLHLRVPWTSAIPAPLLEWDATGAHSALAAWSPDSIATLSALLLANLSRNVRLTKLHHITITGDSKEKNEANRAPPLLDLLYWYDSHRHTPGAVRGLYAIARLLLWIVHSTSIRFAATFEEVVLWLKHLGPATAPTFLHVLNSLLQQSLSKVADRVVGALSQGTNGILVAAADAFVGRTKEKLGTRAAAKDDLWQRHLRAQLPAFETVLRRVKGEWAERKSVLDSTFGSYIAALLKRKDLLALQLLARSNQAQQQDDVATQTHSVGYQLLSALHRSVALPAEGQDAEGVVAVMRRLSLQTAHQNVSGSSKAPDHPPASVLVKHLLQPFQFTTEEEEGSGQMLPWLATGAVCWTLVSFMMTVPPLPTEHGGGGSDEDTSLAAFAAALLMQLLSSRKALIESWPLRDASQTASISTMLLAAIRLVFAARKVAAASGEDEGEAAPPTDDVDFVQLEQLVCCLYSGTDTVSDRSLYASLLYLSGNLSKAVAKQLDGDDDDMSSSSSEDEGGQEESILLPITDDAVEEEGDDGSEEEDAAPPQAPLESDNSDGEEEKQQRRRRKPVLNKSRFFVNKALQRVRFLVGDTQLSTGSQQVPEVVMLSRLMGSWLEETTISHALRMPLAVSNRRNLGSILSDIFPEYARLDDLHLAPLHTLSLHAAPDPRFIVPLIYTVACIRQRRLTFVPSALLVRCHPILLRATSCTSGALRRLAASTLALVHDLMPPLQRQLSNTARLLIHTSKGQRLLAPHSAFLVRSLSVLRDVTHPLHSRVVGAIKRGDLLSGVTPLRDQLFALPNTVVTGDPTEEYQTKQRAAAGSGVKFDLGAAKTTAIPCPPHFSTVADQLRSSCATVADYKLLDDCRVPHILLEMAGIASGVDHIRRQCFDVLSHLLRTNMKVGSVMARSLALSSWCVSRVESLLLHHGDGVRSTVVEVLPIIQLLEAAEHAVGPTLSLRDRKQHVAAVVALITIIRQRKMLSSDILLLLLSAMSAAVPSPTASSSSRGDPLRAWDAFVADADQFLPTGQDLMLLKELLAQCTIHTSTATSGIVGSGFISPSMTLLARFVDVVASRSQ